MRRPFWLLIPATFVLVLAAGSALHPDPSGLGTHRALGLPKCLFLQWTGLPCPGCGLTTSFVHLLHGQWSQAFAVHPLGPLLFLGLAFASILALAEYFRRPTPLGRFLTGAGAHWTYAGLALVMGAWLYRLIGIWRHAS